MSFSKIPEDKFSTFAARGARLDKSTKSRYLAAENALSAKFEVKNQTVDFGLKLDGVTPADLDDHCLKCIVAGGAYSSAGKCTRGTTKAENAALPAPDKNLTYDILFKKLEAG